MAGARPVTRSTASASATPAASVSNAVARSGVRTARDGARSTDTYSPAPGGENQTRPRRPRPAVCVSAMTTAPSWSPLLASAEATSLVDPIVEKNNVGAPRRRRSTRESASAKSGGNGSGCVAHRRLQRLDFEADVGGRRRMGQRAGRHEIGAGRRELRNPLERDAARNLNLRPSVRRDEPPRECRPPTCCRRARCPPSRRTASSTSSSVCASISIGRSGRASRTSATARATPPARLM